MKNLDYNHSLLSLSSSILTYFGVKTEHKTLSELDLLLAKNYKNVVVMLFDGMGTAILEKHLPQGSFLRKHFITTISSVFPPTTTAATTTAETGLSPIEHGWLGWSLYFDEVSANVNIYPNTISGTESAPAADYHIARRYLPYKSVFEKIQEATGGKASTFNVSPYSEFKIQSVEQICQTVKDLCKNDGQKYIYTYWPQPDYDMHDLGTGHKKVTEHLLQINDMVKQLCQSVQDTLFIITADHGLIDTEWKFLEDYPDITNCLKRMPSMETRSMSLFIKPGMKDQFRTAFEKHFGSCYTLLSKEEVLSLKLFGSGTPHKRSTDFIGDFIAVATKNIAIDCGQPTDDVFKAAHAGLTADEMDIPFIAVECI